jgi:hypothetical protein
MAEHQEPFADVTLFEGGFSIPRLKWRELVFVGALRETGDRWVRDPERPLPPFRVPGLFPEGVRFRVVPEGERVLLYSDSRKPLRRAFGTFVL